MKVNTNIMTWGDNHKFYNKDYDYIHLLAKYKAFYFDNVCLNGIKIDIKN